MAKVYVSDATVEEVFESKHGWGVRVSETREVRGEKRKDQFTLWFRDRPEVDEGWVISASGYLSARVREYESNDEVRHIVDLSLNAAAVLSVVAESSAVPAPDVDVWDRSGERF